MDTRKESEKAAMSLEDRFYGLQEKIVDLSDELEKKMSPSEWAKFLKIDAYQGSISDIRLGIAHIRLKSVLPKCYWPLLGAAFSSDDDTWSAFQAETVDIDVKYRVDTIDEAKL